MHNVHYSKQSDYELVNKNQDIRGWPVKDAAGAQLGTVRDLVVDTDEERITSLLLDNGRAVPATDVILADHVVLFGSRQQGVTGGNRQNIAGTQQTATRTRTETTPTKAKTSQRGEEVLPVVEEFLKIGKRNVAAGHVKVATEVTSRPVEQDVQLRQEHVSVERRPVNREVSPADVAQMQGRTIEMTAQSEEAVVAKVARVVEEIVLRKDVTQTTQHVRENVKHTEVRVEDDSMERFRPHYQASYAQSGYGYEQMLPAYRFGSSMRGDSRFSGKNWNEVEPNARTAWEERNPGTWERFKDAVQHAWSKVTD